MLHLLLSLLVRYYLLLRLHLLLLLLLESLLLHDVGVVVQCLVKLQLLHFFTVLYLLVLWDTVLGEFLAEEVVICEGSLSSLFAHTSSCWLVRLICLCCLRSCRGTGLLQA